MILTALKTYIDTAKTHLEGSVSQNFDIGLSFCFMFFRRKEFWKFDKNIQKLHFFCFKIKTRA